jgi:hypothetical protein
MDGSVHADPDAQYRRDGNYAGEKNFYAVDGDLLTSSALLRWSEAWRCYLGGEDSIKKNRLGTKRGSIKKNSDNFLS